jgi:hypothetical protein
VAVPSSPLAGTAGLTARDWRAYEQSLLREGVVSETRMRTHAEMPAEAASSEASAVAFLVSIPLKGALATCWAPTVDRSASRPRLEPVALHVGVGSLARLPGLHVGLGCPLFPTSGWAESNRADPPNFGSLRTVVSAADRASSAQLLATDPESRSAQLDPICVVGFSGDCRSIGELAHPTGLASLLSWPVRLLGSSTNYGSIVSLSFLWLAAVCLIVLFQLWGIGRRYGVLAAALFLAAPACLALGGSSLAEPTAAGLIMMAVLLSQVLLDRQQSRYATALSCVGLVSTLTVAVLVKRESLALMVGLALGAAVAWVLAREAGADRQAGTGHCRHGTRPCHCGGDRRPRPL